MIFPAAHMSTKRKLVLGQSSDEEKSGSSSDITSDFEDSDDPMDDKENNDLDDKELTLNKIWSAISPLNDETDIVGKWLGVIYSGKKRSSLFIAKVNKRFLHDENGKVNTLYYFGRYPKTSTTRSRYV